MIQRKSCQLMVGGQRAVDGGYSAHVTCIIPWFDRARSLKAFP
jgi:hypothetical protein